MNVWLSFRPDRFLTTADVKHWHHLCCACCKSGILTRHACPYKIQNRKSTRGIQSDIFNRWPWSQNIKAARRQREYKMPLRAREAYAASVQDLPHHKISLFLTFPLKSEEEYTTAAETLTCRPSISQIKRTYQQSRGAAQNTFSHICQRFQVLPRLSAPQQEQLWALKVPQRGEWRKEGERTLIWLCNTVQFAIGQWNSISFFPLWSISIWRASTDIVFP